MSTKPKVEPPKNEPMVEAPTTSAEPAKTGPLHSWVDGDGRGVWHYCGACKVVRYPNGKLDAQVCPGASAPRIHPVYVKKAAPGGPATKKSRRSVVPAIADKSGKGPNHA